MTVKGIFQKLIAEAAKKRASDVYILPQANGFGVHCYTASGIERLCDYDDDVGSALIRHVKYGANMDISDGRRPQLGRWLYILDGKEINLRVSSVGDFLNRESVVVRILYDQAVHTVSWQDEKVFHKLVDHIGSESGLILLAGRMGSGKTTTLYRAVSGAHRKGMVLTIEDPVEIVAPDFLQLQVNEQAGMAYPDLLKLALRHHPDIMIVGEIRDAKTARIVVEAALTGHLILSTVHARSAIGVWYRMLDFGIDRETLHQVLTGVGYQRLGIVDGCPVASLSYLSGEELHQTMKTGRVGEVINVEE
jgi:competence protein ComGA